MTEKQTSVQTYILIAVVVVAAFFLLVPENTPAETGANEIKQLQSAVAALNIRCDKLEREITGTPVDVPAVEHYAEPVVTEMPSPEEPKEEPPAKPAAVECTDGTCYTQRPKLFPRLRLFNRR